MKRALIIAPHPDDEINLAGQLMVYLNKKNIEIFVMYTTNGDAEVNIGNKRIQEAINANLVLGVDSKHVIFLGYPNEWRDNTHIYNADPEMILASKLGKTKTNSIQNHPEFCMLRHGKHHDFTRNNFKQDYKEVIEYLRPDIIVAPEFDSHSDHRAASLLFDEIMEEVLKDKKDYRPVVLKKYIHEGVWYGPKDYYQMLPTQTEGPRVYCGGLHDLDSPSFKWEHRIQCCVAKETLTDLITKNIVFKAASKHKVTTAWYEMQRVINSDIIYWERRTDNICLCANISATSGTVKYINDFKMYDTVDVNMKKDAFAESEKYCWRPDNDDSKKIITIKFDCPQNIKEIIIFEDCNHQNHIKKLKISAKDMECIVELDNTGAATKIPFKCINVTDINLQVLNWVGTPGISEVEIYSTEKEPLFEDIYYIDSDTTKIDKVKIIQKIEKILFMLRFLFAFKLKYEFNKRIRGKC